MEDKKVPQSALKKVLANLDTLQDKKQSLVKSKKEIKQQPNIDKQTVSDDFDVEKAKQKQILHYETIIRKTLELFNISYDELIKMDGKSAYNKAVQFYPYLLDEVKKSECPPLTALYIAKQMQPYLEFTGKYGTSIEQIKQSLKQELNDEMQQTKKPAQQVKQTPAKPVKQASAFSDIGNAITQNSSSKDSKQVDDTLASFFAR